MERVRVSNDFFLDEFVPPELYARFREKSLLWVRPEIIRIAQALREKFGQAFINTWAARGKVSAAEFLRMPLDVRKGFYTESGLRMPDSTTGAKFSMHKYGCAIDLKFTGETPETVRKYVVDNYERKLRGLGLTRMEAETPGWVHLDIAHTGSENLVVFKM